MYKLEKSRYRLVLLICLGIFLVICLGTSIYYGNKLLLGNFEEYNNDDVKYLRSAQTLLETGKLTYKYTDAQTVFIMPGFTIALLPFVATFGQAGGAIAFRIFSGLLQTFTMYVIYLIVRKIFKSDKIAIATIMLNMIYVPNIYVTTQILTETIFLAILMNLFYICIYAVEERKIKYYVIGGILWGISILFKPVMLVFPSIIFVMMVFNKYTIKEMFKYAWIPLAIMIGIMSPWVIRNYIVFDRFIPLTLSSGNPKLQGAYVNYNQDIDYQDKLDLTNVGKYGNEIETDEVEKNIAKEVIKYNIKNNTFEYIMWMTIGKTFENFSLPFLWFQLYGISYVTQGIMHFSLLALSILGIIYVLIFKKEIYLAKTLMILILFFNVVHLPYYCFSRYVYPIMPVLFSFGAVMIVAIKNKCGKNKNV